VKRPRTISAAEALFINGSRTQVPQPTAGGAEAPPAIDPIMKEYIVDEEQHLSPVVVGTTVVLIAVFGVGVLYQLATALL